MKTTIGVTNVVAFLIATNVPAATLAQDRALRDQPKSQQAPPEVIQTPIAPPPLSVLRGGTPEEAAAQSRAQAEQERARETASKARSTVPLDIRAWAARIIEAYPIAAKHDGIEGIVGVAVTVSHDGRATDCKVTRLGDYAILDDAACKGIERYARFEPALDPKDRPIPGKFSMNITYRI